MGFYFSNNDISTNLPFRKLCREGIEVWWDKFKNTPHLNNYEVYIGGAILNDIETVDLDIILIGNIKYLGELKNILDAGLQLGFRHRILVDIKWASRIYDFNEEHFQP